MTDYLALAEADIATALGVTLGAQLTTTEAAKAIAKAAAAISRFYPLKSVAEKIISTTVTDEAFTTAAADGTYKALANKAITPNSEVVTTTDGLTTYVKDTDYTMNYIEGSITTISGGAMVVLTAYEIDYTMDEFIVDITSLLTNPITILAVEDVRQGVPQGFFDLEWHDNYLTVRAKGQHSQSILSDTQILRIWYHAMHTGPTTSVQGTWPRFLDEVMLVGAEAYALQILAQKQQQAAVTDNASVGTALAAADDDVTAIGTAITAVATALGAMGTELDKIDGGAGEPYNLALAALAKVTTHAGTAAAALDKVDVHIATDAEAALDKVATHAGTEADSLLDLLVSRTNVGVDAEITLNKARLAKDTVGGVGDAGLSAGGLFFNVAAQLTGATDSAKEALDTITATLLGLATTALALVGKELGTDTPSTLNADAYLNVGDDLINSRNFGIDPANQNRLYAETKVAMARTYAEKVAQTIALMQARNTEAANWMGVAQTWIAEAQTRVGLISNALRILEAYVTEGRVIVDGAGQRINMANAFIAEAQARIAMSTGFVQEATGRLGVCSAFIQEAQTQIAAGGLIINKAQVYNQQALGYAAQADRKLALWNAYLEQGKAYQANASGRRETSNMFRVEATERLADFLGVLRDRAQTASQHQVASVLQYEPAQNQI